MKLLELFDQIYKWRWQFQEPNAHQAEFRTDREEKIEVAFEIDDNGSKRMGGYVWEIVFDRLAAEDAEKYNRSAKTWVTGEGDAFKIFATVADIIIDMSKKEEVKAFFFTAKEPNRKKLYSRMLPRLGQKLGMEIKDTPQGFWLISPGNNW